jgi:hypothetical protein
VPNSRRYINSIVATIASFATHIYYLISYLLNYNDYRIPPRINKRFIRSSRSSRRNNRKRSKRKVKSKRNKKKLIKHTELSQIFQQEERKLKESSEKSVFKRLSKFYFNFNVPNL